MPRETSGPVEGTTLSWSDDEGWGVLASPDVDGGVWAHFSNIDAVGYRSLKPGEAVQFTFETPGQDGNPHRAVRVRAK
jgi:CspA family cold shock protein